MGEGGIFYRPYRDEAKDFLYNLLFCDDRELFRPRDGAPAGDLAVILADTPGSDALHRIAGDEKQESRVRALAFNRLRELGIEVPAGVLLGTIIENAMEEGHDTLAAYADQRVRYLNHHAGPAIFEGGPLDVSTKAAKLIMQSQSVIERIGPSDKPRLPPPKTGNARMSFIVSDGLYFGEAPLAALAGDGLAKPVIRCALELLQLVVDAALKK